ncbi:hypothetical protein BCS42_12700 [Crenothrix sp. D3]|nr:hypothetical protein BCS42_12700 [Crenothrix sp. D3]
MHANPVDNMELPDSFAVLIFAGLQLLIPQNDIFSLEPTIDMTPAALSIGGVGQLQQSNQAYALYALSAELTLLNSCPESYRIAVLMKNVNPVYGVLCEQIDTIKRDQLSIHPVPAAMRRENSPLLALALVGEEVRYISSANALSRLLSH